LVNRMGYKQWSALCWLFVYYGYRKVVPIYGMKAYGEVEVQLHSFLTSAQNGGEWSPSSTRPLYLRFLFSRKPVGARVVLETFWEI
jgi:hypothetical protein